MTEAPVIAKSAGLRTVLATLCATQITSWGVLYYAFPVLAPEIGASMGWSAPAVTAGFSIAQLVAALAGIPIGRLVDRQGPRRLMTAGSLVAVPALLALATARDLVWFVGAWLLVGLAMGALLYPPAFAALTRWYGDRRVGALTVLTLAGGLASTVFAPLTAVLSAWLGWRGTYVVLAGILAVVTIPGHLWGLRRPWPRLEHRSSEHTAPGRIARGRPFLVLVTALSLTAFTTFAVVVNLVPLLAERGVSTGLAAVALGLGGTGQVLGRMGYGVLSAKTSVRTRTTLVLLAVAVTTAVLGVLTSAAALIVAAVVAGMARGVFTLLQATAVTDRWGSVHYGRLTGLLSAPLTITMSLAPWAGATLAGFFGGYSTTFLALGAVAVLASSLALGSVPGRKP
jgi:MFS family permease